jgi:hypothetical protein
MSPLHPGFRFLLVAIVLATASAFACAGAALAQQPQTPTELWEEYPLAPDEDRSAPDEDRSTPGSDAPQPRDPSDEGAPPVGGDAGAVEDEPFPLLQIILALGLLLGVAFGVGALMRPQWARERFGAVRGASLGYRPRPVDVSPRPRTEFLVQGTRPRPRREPASPAVDPGKRPEARKQPAKPPKPTTPPPAHKNLSGHEPPPAKRSRPAKPRRPAKWAGDAKPPGGARPAGAAKSLVAAKPGGAVKRPKAGRPVKRKPPIPRTFAAERQPGTPQETPNPRPAERNLTCSIFGWRSGRVADFYALASGLQGRDWIVERSPRFEWLAGDTPDEAYEAHAILVNALLRAGWRSVGTEGAWYRQRFERPVEGPSSNG